MTLLDMCALVCTAAGLVAFATAIVAARSWHAGLGMALDLWLAAGLLRLAGPPSTTRLMAAGGILVVRQVVALGLRTSPMFR